ncbi:MAG: hypothetical protein N2C14_21325, partial [Planctomycetales bacterium]
MSVTCRLIMDPPASGDWNMATDEALLHTCETKGEACLRFYQWSEPTVSLGYFQALADRGSHNASLGCHIVRRATGGGALIHDREITYSFTSPADSPWSKRPELLYDAFHETLAAVMQERGAPAVLCDSPEKRQPEPFLCFQRRARGDVLIEGVKVAGSAQRRPRGAVLQHGGVLLSRSEAAPELPGLEQLTGNPWDVESLVENWTARLTVRLEMQTRQSDLSESERQFAEAVCEEKYA